MATAPEPMLALPSAERRTQPNLFNVGVVLGGVAGLMGIGLFVAAWLNMSHLDKPWPPKGVHVSNYPGTILTLTMLMASVTVEWGVYAARRHQRTQATTALVMMAAFGLAFLNLLWFFGRGLGFGVASSPFATLLYSMLAVSGIAVAVGTVVVVVATARVIGHQALGPEVEPARAAAWFWQAVAAAWIIVYYMVWISK